MSDEDDAKAQVLRWGDQGPVLVDATRYGEAAECDEHQDASRRFYATSGGEAVGGVMCRYEGRVVQEHVIGSNASGVTPESFQRLTQIGEADGNR